MTKIKELSEKISKARIAYYNGKSIVSDDIFDAWMLELSELDPFHNELIKVGSEPVSEWKKHTHTIPMGSLNKVNSFEELKSWSDKYVKRFFLTHKLDGLSLACTYEDGKLVKAATRGSGSIGEDIYSNVLKITNVPKTIKLEGTVHVRGEIMFPLAEFEKFKEEYSNPRNAASGISRRYDGTNCDQLKFYAYQIFCDVEIKSESEQFELLNELHFTTPTYKILDTTKEVEKYLSDFDRSSLPYDVDGIVLRENDLKTQKSFGDINLRPRAAIAYKFADSGKESTITSIDFQVGSTGIITPVAYFTPVQLDGAMIKKCSLYNFDFVKELQLNVGAKVLIIRANQVIPKIKECIEPCNGVIEHPKFCPECQSPTVFSGAHLKCSNPKDCVKSKKGKLIKFIKAMNIMEWGDKLIDQLVDTKLVTQISDLYKVTPEQLSALDRMGDKSAKNCIDELADKKSVYLERFLGAIGVPGVSESTFKLIIDSGFNTFEKVINVTDSQLSGVKGLGRVKIDSILNFFTNSIEEIKEIHKHLIITEKSVKLAGESFCFTGSFESGRDFLKELVKSGGGIVKDSVSKDTKYLVTNDTTSGSSKNVKAEKLGVKIISEKEFLEIVA